MKPILVVYHTLFFRGTHPLQYGVAITREQMDILKSSGLEDAASEIICGVNGDKESEVYALQNLPTKAKIHYHGLEANSEIPTLEKLEAWLPGHKDWNVLYFHAKGATRSPTDPYNPNLAMDSASYFNFVTRWRNCMMNACVVNWERCVRDMEDLGYDSAGCHWMTNVGVPPIDNIWGGNFWWARASFLMTLPKLSETNTVHRPDLPDERRYEAEHWIGSGPRLPEVRDYHVNGIGSCP